MGLLFKILGLPLIDKLFGFFDKYLDKSINRDTLKAEITKQVVQLFGEVSKQQAQVIVAELNGEDWLQRNWRPLVALSFAFIIFFYGLVLPIMVDWFGFPPVRVGDQLLEWIMTGVMVCLGGYIGGRSLEKIAKIALSIFGR